MYLQAIGFGSVISQFKMRHQWNIPSKLVNVMDGRLNSRELGHNRRLIPSSLVRRLLLHQIPSSTLALRIILIGGPGH